MNAVTRALVAIAAGAARFGRFFGYLAAGTLTHADLRKAAESQWNDYSRGRWSAESGLLAWEKDFYLKQLSPGGRVLLVGCGGGRDLIGLIEAGYRADGLDIAPEALARCHENLARRGFAARLFEGSLEEAMARSDERYDAVVFAWLAYGYVLESGRRARTLRVAASLLKPRGRILLTYIPRAREPSRWPIRAARTMALLSRSDWRPEFGDVIEISKPNGETRFHVEHRFAPDEVPAEAKAAGLEVAFHEVAEAGRVVLDMAA